MNKVLDFIKKNKYAFIWTICYVLVMWAVLKYMFNFDMFSGAQWNILFHAQLRGFPGFVFGILILAAIPLYIATTMVIYRTKKPLFTIKLPSFLQPVKIQTDKAPDTTPPPPTPTPEKSVPQKVYPTEMRAAFARARAHTGPTPKSNFDITNITAPKPSAQQTPELSQPGELPLPSDFDISTQSDESDIPSFTPVFSDIDFDTPPDQPPTSPTDEPENDLTPVTEYLSKNGTEFTVTDNIIFTSRDAIAAHNDPDFWVADNETWFAAGKQKPSPADAVLAAGTERGLRPVLYLGQKNIMDLDIRCTQWKNSGITVITDLDELK